MTAKRRVHTAVVVNVALLAAAAGRPLAAERFVPLSELGSAGYRGEDGGLYGGGSNEPPASQRSLAERALARIEPLDRKGKPSAEGKIVLLAIGMSNTTQEFSVFARLANGDRRKRPELVLVDGAQGGADAILWAGGQRPQRRPRGDPWRGVQTRLEAAGVTAEQVQVAWIKQALAGPERYGEFPGHADALERALAEIVRRAQAQYPNLRLAFVSSRTYGGYATNRLNPEPYAYESGFAVRGLVARQIAGEPALNCDATRGPVRAPVLLWGPYLWADGEAPRKADGLVWRRADFREDGTHPSEQGRRKVAELLLEFFTTDPLGKGVFLR
jgi:hypothetical protein